VITWIVATVDGTTPNTVTDPGLGTRARKPQDWVIIAATGRVADVDLLAVSIKAREDR
jgi:hypothetical protein